jgi:hypothetical protein
MAPSNLRPKWWQLYLTLPLLVVLFVADSRLKISTRGHQVVQLGIIVLVYGLIHLWLKANARALSNLDRIQDYGMFKVIQISSQDRHPMLQFSDSEIKGILSNIFEMEPVNGELLPVDDVSQELRKE